MKLPPGIMPVRRVQHLGLSVLLFIVVCTFSAPTTVFAKARAAEKHLVEKKAGKKLSRKVVKDKKENKKVKQAERRIDPHSNKKTTAKSKLVVKNHNKNKSNEEHSKTSHKNKRKDRADKEKRLIHTKNRRKSSSSSHAFKRSPQARHTPRQAYYVIPDHLANTASKPESKPEPEPSTHPLQVGTASYYADDFNGGRTASGERFDQNKLTCAHSNLPFGCKIRVTNLRNHRAVDVKVNDRGGFAKHGRVIDLSKAAAREIGMVGTGTAKVKIEVLK